MPIDRNSDQAPRTEDLEKEREKIRQKLLGEGEARRNINKEKSNQQRMREMIERETGIKGKKY